MTTRKNPFAFLIPADRKPRAMDYMDTVLAMPWRDRAAFWSDCLLWLLLWVWEYALDLLVLLKMCRRGLLARKYWTEPAVRWLIVDQWQAWRRGADPAMLQAQMASILKYPQQLRSCYMETAANG